MKSDPTKQKQLAALQRLRASGRLDVTLTRMMNRLEQEAEEERALESAERALDEAEERARTAPVVHTASAAPEASSIALLTIDARGCGWELPAARIAGEARAVAYRLRSTPSLNRIPVAYWKRVRDEVTKQRPIAHRDVVVIGDVSRVTAVVDAVLANGGTYVEAQREQLERDVIACASAADCEVWFKAEPGADDRGDPVPGTSSDRVGAARRRDIIRRRLGELGELHRIDAEEAARENARNSRIRRAG